MSVTAVSYLKLAILRYNKSKKKNAQDLCMQTPKLPHPKYENAYRFSGLLNIKQLT